MSPLIPVLVPPALNLAGRILDRVVDHLDARDERRNEQHARETALRDATTRTRAIQEDRADRRQHDTKRVEIAGRAVVELDKQRHETARLRLAQLHAAEQHARRESEHAGLEARRRWGHAAGWRATGWTALALGALLAAGATWLGLPAAWLWGVGCPAVAIGLGCLVFARSAARAVEHAGAASARAEGRANAVARQAETLGAALHAPAALPASMKSGGRLLAGDRRSARQ